MPQSKNNQDPKQKRKPGESEGEALSPPVTFVEDEQDIHLHETADAPSDDLQIPDELPILPLRGLVVYPQTAIPLTVGQPRSIKLVDEVKLEKYRKDHPKKDAKDDAKK